MSELSHRLSQLRQWLDDVVEADRLVDNISDLLGQRNGLRAQLAELEAEIAEKRRAVEQEIAVLDVDLATRRSAFAEELAHMEEQTATAKTEQARAEHDLRDVRMRLDHARAVYDEVRSKFA